MAYYDQWFRVRPLSKGLYKQLKAFEKEYGVGDDQVVHFALTQLFRSLSDHPDNQNDPECKVRDVAAIKAFRPGREPEAEETPVVAAPPAPGGRYLRPFVFHREGQAYLMDPQTRESRPISEEEAWEERCD